MTNDAIRLWNDNPTGSDLLGFSGLIDTVVQALLAPELDPVTVAIQSPWGGGKSSALSMIEERLKDDDSVIVLRADPWEYENVADMRTALIAQVLTALETAAKDNSDVKQKIRGLMKRIAWSQVAVALGSAVITQSVDPEALVKAFTPQENEKPRNMAGFRADFAEAMNALSGTERIVVLVDDLDRCLPETVVAVLEAIKVFLSVPKMTFVLAAEEELIRSAIEQHGGRGPEFANRYLEKIVQVPVTLPRLTKPGAVVFVALLLAERRINDPDQFAVLAEDVARNWDGGLDGIFGRLNADTPRPTDEEESLAYAFAEVLSADRWSSPRAVKRFLNGWGIRNSVARARGIFIDHGVSLKLAIFEERDLTKFTAFASMSDQERSAALARLDAWVNGDDGAEYPDEAFSSEMQEWGRSGPRLSDHADEVGAYLSLARTFHGIDIREKHLDWENAAFVEFNTGADTKIKPLVASLKKRKSEELAVFVPKVMDRLASFKNPTKVFDAICDVAAEHPSASGAVYAAVRRRGFRTLNPGSILRLARMTNPTDILKEIAADDSDASQPVRNTAREKLGMG
ncbi:hypothetical protein ASE25_05935 [Terrabacter sp. Root85]|uniref:KAP family P-loop NTPase fold protein n=1 Tax=Terrabacter sp. Root85 TaxID=1736603 RepID=UPI0006F3AFCC|nr:P-loop NTPase fold protein [Terrabacter sp. Root85]KRC92834.1 hypothetical protein ASE25_05935 [Terrabacter sp. Root85]